MNAIPFDTLKLARGLEAAGMSPAMANGSAEALALAMKDADCATKADVTLFRTELKGEIGALRGEVKADIAALRAEVKSDIVALRTELKHDMSTLRTELKNDMAALRTELKNDMVALHTELKSDMNAQYTELKSGMVTLHTELKGDIATLRGDMDLRFTQQDAKFDAFRASVKSEFAAVHASFELLRRDMTIKLGGMIFLAAGLMIAAMRLIPPPH